MQEEGGALDHPEDLVGGRPEAERLGQAPDEGVGGDPGHPGRRVLGPAGRHDQDRQLGIVLGGQGARSVSSSQDPGSRVTTTATTAGAAESIRMPRLIRPSRAPREPGTPKCLQLLCKA